MIKNLSDLLTPHIQTNDIIKTIKYEKLLPSGENYGSVMFKVDVIIANNQNEEKTMHLVAKILPETEQFREIFRVQTTYTNEMAFYNTVIPALVGFQTDIGVKHVLDCYAKCYGTRKNLSGIDNDIIDDDAVLLLENLKDQGYKNMDRLVGFDLDTTKFILKDLANFHGSFLSFKLKRADVFKDKVLPYCVNFEVTDDSWDVVCKKYIDEILKNKKSTKELAKKIKFWSKIKRSSPRESSATVIHGDLWMNNIMQKFENGKIVGNKIVDFQIFTYGSRASDVFFLLWTSVAYPVLKNHLDSLLEHYHNEFLKVLNNHHCDTSFYTYEEFLEELRIESKYEFGHSIQFLTTVALPNRPNIHQETDEYIRKRIKNASEDFKEKVMFMIEESNKRGWL